jgi:hypothetical protein
MALKPQDVLVVLKLSLHEGEPWDFRGLGDALGISASEAHAAFRRATKSGLVIGRKVNKKALLEFLIHGLKYVFATEWRGVSRGMPTAHAAAPLKSDFGADELPPVWPDPEGRVRGEVLAPLYKSVVKAAKADEKLYEALALVDAVRSGRARERKKAELLLAKRLA